MPAKRLLAATVALFVLAAVFGPAVARTWKIAQSAHGLTLLASLSDDEFSYDPWSSDCFLIRQHHAIWILEKYDWPYQNARTHPSIWSQPMSLIHHAIAARRLDASSGEVDARMLELVRLFVARGEQIEERYIGLTPLHAAILLGDSETATALIELGSEPSLRTVKPGKPHDKLNAVEFAEFLADKDPSRYEPTLRVLQSARIGT